MDSQFIIPLAIISAIATIGYVIITKSPFNYPYFRVYFDVSGKRNPKIENYVNEYLRKNKLVEINDHKEIIENWENYNICVANDSFISALRRKQYYAALDKENAYQFILTRKQTRYKQKNYIKKPYVVNTEIAISSYSYDEIVKRYNQMQRVDKCSEINPVNIKRNVEKPPRQLRNGCSVTQRIKITKQPRGGFINPKCMQIIRMEDNISELHENENIHASLIGLTVDYMSRYLSGTSVEKAFEISIRGADIAGEVKKAMFLAENIKGLDNKSIINAVKLCAYDVCVRAGMKGFKPVELINPDIDTIENIRVMIQRSLNFFKLYGPKVLEGFTFEGGYTDNVNSGDGDFLTQDTLWDFKVSKTSPKKEHTLQLMMYWRMGSHSIHNEFKNIKYIGVYNPRLNTIYRLAIEDISEETINDIEKNVIGY